jgi:hypothetical protein
VNDYDESVEVGGVQVIDDDNAVLTLYLAGEELAGYVGLAAEAAVGHSEDPAVDLGRACQRGKKVPRGEMTDVEVDECIQLGALRLVQSFFNRIRHGVDRLASGVLAQWRQRSVVFVDGERSSRKENRNGCHVLSNGSRDGDGRDGDEVIAASDRLCR